MTGAVSHELFKAKNECNQFNDLINVGHERSRLAMFNAGAICFFNSTNFNALSNVSFVTIGR